MLLELGIDFNQKMENTHTLLPAGSLGRPSPMQCSTPEPRCDAKKERPLASFLLVLLFPCLDNRDVAVSAS